MGNKIQSQAQECVIHWINYNNNDVEIFILRRNEHGVRESIVYMSKIGQWKSLIQLLNTVMVTRNFDKQKESYDTHLKKLWNKGKKLKLFIHSKFYHLDEYVMGDSIYESRVFAVNQQFLTDTIEKKYSKRVNW